MSGTAGKMITAAASGIAVGATGMHLWGRRTRDAVETSQEEAEVAPTRQALNVSTEIPSGAASDFIKPFVSRYGYPDLDQIILPSEEYTSCWDTRTRNARWVVERINLDTVSGPADRRKANFRADSRLDPPFRSNLSDFAGSGFDRGHLAPAGDHKTTQGNLTQTFLLSNTSPQTPGFNRGYWADFEEFVRELVAPDNAVALEEPSPISPLPFKDVYVITGPLFLPSKESSLESASDGAVDADGEGIVEVPASSGDPAEDKWVVKYDILGNPMQMVGVPTHFFKLIVAEPYDPPADITSSSSSSGTTFIAAFAMPNTKIPSGTDLRNYLVPIAALESVAGMRFLGAASGVGILDDDPKVSLDMEALVEREKAGVPALSSDWGGAGGEGGSLRRARLPRRAVGSSAPDRKLFRHLCSAVDCVVF